MADNEDQRVYLRHLADIPLEYDLAGVAAGAHEHLADISAGGLSFRAVRELPAGALVTIRIPLTNPRFQTTARVAWCRPDGDQFLVGVAFLHASDGFRARMVEQVCCIEQYKREAREKEGRVLTGTEAALEWIGKNAADFPRFQP